MRRLILFFFIVVGVQVFAAPAYVILLRHGEKPDKGPQLNAEGWKRAELLPKLFAPEGALAKFGRPAALYAMGARKKNSSIRAVQTLQFLSQDLAIPINSQYSRDNFGTMVDVIMKNPDYQDKVIVICWEHKVLTDIASALGIVKAPHYPGKRYDRIWVVDLKNLKAPTLIDLPQKLLPTDSN